MKTFTFALAGLLAVTLSSSANALMIEYSSGMTKVNAAQAADGAPADGDVHEFFVTTDADILSVGNVLVTLDGGAALYQNVAFGSDSAPPNPALAAAFPSTVVDSFVTTPGANTSLLGGDINTGAVANFGDLSDDGPVQNFRFAQLTVPAGATGLFTGQVSINDGAGGSFDQPFSFAIGGVAIPEPSSLALLGLGMVGFVGRRRRNG